MSKISKLTPDTLIIIAAAISIIFTQGRDSTEINAIGNFLALLGQSFQTKSAQLDLIEENEEIKKQIYEMEDEIKKLRRRLC